VSNPAGWRELQTLQFQDDGSIDWSERPFAKRWSLRRLGKTGLLELLAEHVALRAECFWVRPDAEPCAVTLGAGVREALRDDAETHHWFVHVHGRWLIELSAQGTFTFEFTSARNTKLLRKLKGLEREWARGNAPRAAPGVVLSADVAQALSGMFCARPVEGGGDLE